jgi:hypothetical protein
VDRLRYLAAIFAIEVCAYAIMETHHHSILRTRPDIVATWSDLEVATRWLTLCPPHRKKESAPGIPIEEEIRRLADRPERIAELRKRLVSISWFMGRLNEFIARKANQEDKVKGRFWEGRFKCQVLLDEAARASCMVYVDLNPIRAGLAPTPEESDFTSIQERIRSWQQESTTTTSLPHQENAAATHSVSIGCRNTATDTAKAPISMPDPRPDLPHPPGGWLCPIGPEAGRRGILEMSTAQYFDLVDKSGRIARSDKRGSIDADLAPILLRIGANPNTWIETISRFGSRFRVAAGLATNLQTFADRLGRRWIQGAATARTAFISKSPPLAQITPAT